MKISKFLNKIKKYLKDKSLAQTKQDKIKEIIDKLSIKKAQLKQEIKDSDSALKKEKNQKEFKAISKLLKKSKKLILKV